MNHIQPHYISHFMIFNFHVSIIWLFSIFCVCLEFTPILYIPWGTLIFETPGNQSSKDNYHWLIQFVPQLANIFNFKFLLPLYVEVLVLMKFHEQCMIREPFTLLLKLLSFRRFSPPIQWLKGMNYISMSEYSWQSKNIKMELWLKLYRTVMSKWSPKVRV